MLLNALGGSWTPWPKNHQYVRACRINVVQRAGRQTGVPQACAVIGTQLYNVGVLSMLIIIVSGLFIGMVLGLQGYLVLTTYSAETSLGMLVALSLLRELGPVVAALLFAGRAGSALTAEIGLMRATEQLSSMEMMAVDPLRRVISPRFWAGVISFAVTDYPLCGGRYLGRRAGWR